MLQPEADKHLHQLQEQRSIQMNSFRELDLYQGVENLRLSHLKLYQEQSTSTKNQQKKKS